MNPSLFGAPLMECKLQNTNMVQRCVMHCLFISLIHFAMQVTSLSYQAASCNIIVGLNTGQVELLQTDPQIAPSTAPQVTLRVVDAMAHQLVKKATIGLHTYSVRRSLLLMCCWSDADCVCRCIRVRFPPTALWWQLAVMTIHSASSILPHRQRCTLRSVMILYVPICPFLF